MRLLRSFTTHFFLSLWTKGFGTLGTRWDPLPVAAPFGWTGASCRWWFRKSGNLCRRTPFGGSNWRAADKEISLAMAQGTFPSSLESFFFVRSFWKWNACGKFSQRKNQEPNMKQWSYKVEVGKVETKKRKTYQSFEMTNAAALPWGVFTVAHLTSYLEAKSASAVASTCPNS